MEVLPRSHFLRLTRVLFIAFCSLINVGCAVVPSAATQATTQPVGIQLGDSQEQVKTIFGRKGDHQFTALIDNIEYQCISYSFKQVYIKYYFVFKANHLVSILEPAQFFEWEELRENHPKYGIINVSRRKAWDEEENISSIIKAETLSEDEFYESLNDRLEKERKRKKDYNVLPAFILTAPLWIPSSIVYHQKQLGINRKYDPYKIHPGETTRQVESILGKPLFGTTKDEDEVRVYGPEEWLNKSADPQIGPATGGYWIAVVFRKDKVNRIFTNNLFNHTKLALARYRLK